MYDPAGQEAGEGREIGEGLLHQGQLFGQLGHLVVLLPLGDDAGDQEAGVGLDHIHVRGIESEQVRGDELIRLLGQAGQPGAQDLDPAVGQEFQTLLDLGAQFAFPGVDAPSDPGHQRPDHQGNDGHAHDQFGLVLGQCGRGAPVVCCCHRPVLQLKVSRWECVPTCIPRSRNTGARNGCIWRA